MSDIFTKNVTVKPKISTELWGESEDNTVLKSSRAPSVASPLGLTGTVASPREEIEKSTTPQPSGVLHSKKSRWKDAIRKKASVDDTVHSPKLESILSSKPEEVLKAPVHPPVLGAKPISVDISLDSPPNLGQYADLSRISVSVRDSLLPVSTRIVAPETIESVPATTPAPTPPIAYEVIDTDTGCQVQHLVMVVHGINGSEDYLFRNLDRMKESFEQVRSKWYSARTTDSICHLEMINWKASVIGLQSSLFERITPRGSLPVDSRMFINYAISDVAFYLTPSHRDMIKKIVVILLNERLRELKKQFPNKFDNAKVVLVGYSLGSVILHDILSDISNTGLDFEVSQLFLWGSPLAAYLSVKDEKYQSGLFSLPDQMAIYNMYHPHDPVAFRIEPLYYHLDSEIADAELIPYWENNGLLANKAFEKSWESMVTSIQDQWVDVKQAIRGDNFRGPNNTQLVPKRRFDFVLQESMTESISHNYSMLTAHFSYWASRDVALFMLRRMTGLDPQMKFSYQLAYNAFAPWSENYVQYKKLKRMMKRQRRELKDKSQVPYNWSLFDMELKVEIDKFGVFFRETMNKIKGKMDILIASLGGSKAGINKDTKRKKSATELYLELSEIKKFIFLNAEGSRKLVKKFDKLNGSNYLEGYVESSDTIQDMLAEQRAIDAALDQLMSVFADAFTEGDMEAANSMLSKSLTDLVEWEKGTIWNELLRLERNKRKIGTKAVLAMANGMKEDEDGAGNKGVATTEAVGVFGTIKRTFTSPVILANFLVLIMSGIAYFQLIPGLPFHASRCLAVLLLVSGWWSLGTFPLFVSALAVPLLVVACDVLPLASRQASAKLVLEHMWGGSQAMVLASFALAAALSKLRLDKQLACVIISIIKNGRRKIMFALMTIGWSTSFAIGNMASSVLCLSLAAPVLDELPQLDPATADYGRRLLIAIAFACNYGGMTSPIASPQNIVAFASLQPFGTTFAQWVFVAVPTSFILLLITFWYLMPMPHVKLHRAGTGMLTLPLLTTSLTTESDVHGGGDMFAVEQELPPRLTDGMRKKFVWDWRRQAVVGLLFFAAALWMASGITVSVFGDVGLASLLPLLLLFALPGVLTKSDFLSMPWDVCLLLASGGVLSASVSQSKLLAIAGESASSILSSMSPMMCQFICCLFVTLISTGVSHTAAANVLMPFIVELGQSELGKAGAVRFILPVSLCLSAGMALPVSSCPNMNATAIARGTDESQPWVKPTDYLKPGLVLSAITVAVFVFVADPLTAYFCVNTS